MRDLQILILDNGAQLGELELTDSDDFALKLTKSLASINNIGQRNTSFSLDFEVPQTKNNNRLLSGLRFATTSKEILGQKECSIVVDGNQIDKGFVYPFESKLEGNYKLVFKGLNNDWVEKLRDVELNQLNWRDYNTGLRTEDALENFSSTRFGVLNSQNSVNTDLIYPYVNRNNSFSWIDFRPQIHLRSIVISMFEKIGYTVSSAFLESDWVKGGAAVQYLDAFGHLYTHFGLSVDPAFQMRREVQDLLGETIEYKSASVPNTSSNTGSWNTNYIVGTLSLPVNNNYRDFYRFPAIINTIVQDNSSRFNIPTSEFTVGTSGTYTVDFTFKHITSYYDNYHNKFLPWVFQGTGANSSGFSPSFEWYIVKNNTSDSAIDGTVLYSGSNTGGNGQNSMPQQTLSLTGGDKICVFLKYINNASGHAPSSGLNAPSLNYWRTSIQDDSVLTIKPLSNIQLNTDFRINSHIPKGVKCLTLLQDFKTMFNLYFDVDANRKTVIIEPRDDFYLNSFEDITDKIDLNKAPVLNYLTSYKNEMVFKYLTDSKDKYLEQYNKTNDLNYGELTYVMGNNTRFEKGQSTLSTQYLSATIQGGLNTTTANIMTSIIKEEYLDADNTNKLVNQNYGARVFQLMKGRQFDSANVVRRPTLGGAPLIVLTAAMEDYGNTPTYQDRRLTFNATKGLVEEFYAKTLANIEDTTILTVDLVLSLYEFNAWDLRKVYYINEPAEIAGYYITDSIKNFNVTKETPTTVTLVKFKDFIPVAITQGVGNVPIIISPPPQPQEIFCTVNGAIVSCLDNNLQKMYRK
jgi:hypothetical protein